MNSKRIADASAIAVLATMAMTWVSFKGLAMLVSSGFSGFDLMSKGYSFLIVTPIGAIICLLILIYSENNPAAYESNRRGLAIVRILCAIVSALPVIFLIYSIESYDITQETNMWAMMFVALMPPELNEGVWLNLLSILVLGVEGFIDLTRP